MKNNDLQPDDLTQADVNQIAFEIREQTAEWVDFGATFLERPET